MICWLGSTLIAIFCFSLTITRSFVRPSSGCCWVCLCIAHDIYVWVHHHQLCLFVRCSDLMWYLVYCKRALFKCLHYLVPVPFYVGRWKQHNCLYLVFSGIVLLWISKFTGRPMWLFDISLRICMTYFCSKEIATQVSTNVYSTNCSLEWTNNIELVYDFTLSLHGTKCILLLHRKCFTDLY